MSLTAKPLWLEGMFVRPQHFQQSDRWTEHALEGRTAGLSPYGWGLRSLEIDPDLLALGRLSIRSCRAVMPDGTVIDIPNDAPAPPARAFDPTTKQAVVMLALPARVHDSLEVAATGNRQRFLQAAVPARSTTQGSGEAAELAVGRLNLSLVLSTESLDDLVTLPIARIAEIEPAGAIKLAANHIPPCLAYGANERMRSIVLEVLSLLRSRAEALALRADPSRASGDSAGLVDLLMLGTVNSADTVFAHLAATQTLHPEVVYRELVRLAGALSPFDTTTRRAPELPTYRHEDLEPVMDSLLDALRRALAVVVERNVVPLPLQERGYGIHTATITDRTIMQGCRFVLAAIGSVPSETIRTQLPATLKIGPIEQIRDLVSVQLPGIPIRSLPVAPRELPYLHGAVYFELDQSSELWRSVARSAAFAFHVSGDYPDLHLEFWAIRTART
ncbi:type VI secretion system baseplate subunit TssK [Segnochrobactrum spirostomi]|uniref:Type VI secretion system baseplate subunit TssK n=1 Tax=Segnochrobactrum spirostomi TaxID=2608987 RepID=A0A6A7Y883_9HYPH|nr:type VI secretion system baseplate subunit TssK [Segnochrobactrum spirostomi]MQT15066.1 type VI secretion system baseplate subunit TssK [Segnochrobactrum spirostomi]